MDSSVKTPEETAKKKRTTTQRYECSSQKNIFKVYLFLLKKAKGTTYAKMSINPPG